MIYMTLGDLAFNLKIEYDGLDSSFEGVSTDTRTIQPGNVFFALQGPNFDGHDYVTQAAEKGASCAVVSKLVKANIPLITVRDTCAALGALANAWRNNFSCPVIGITGSNGKTTTKEMVAAILEQQYAATPDAVLVSEGSHNNEIGVPKTLFQLNKHHQVAVLEMGMNHSGELDYLSRIADPDIAMITNASAAHLEGLGSVANVAKAKGELLEGLHHDGIGIINADDAYYSYWHKLLNNRPCISFAIDNEDADIRAEIINCAAEKSEFRLISPKGTIEITLPLTGKHNVYNALASSAATLALENVSLENIKLGLEKMTPVKGRATVARHASGAKIIDESYNAVSVSAISAAAKLLAYYPEPRIMVFGDMKEVGDNAQAIHHEAGEAIKAAGVTTLYTYGEASREASQAFGDGATHFTALEPLISTLEAECKPGVTILVKGARSMKMERIVQALLKE